MNRLDKPPFPPGIVWKHDSFRCQLGSLALIQETTRMRTIPFFAALTVAVAMLPWPQRTVAAPDVEFFEKKIRPVLAEHCYACHSATSKKLKGGLRADSREGLLKGGETGPAIVPGKPGASRLLEAMSHRDPDLTMPPKKPKLPAAVLADFERWIKDGAAWPKETVKATPKEADAFDLAKRKRRLPWIWEAPRRQVLPTVKDSSWPLIPVDRFILARLEKEGLKPAPAAEPEIWLRRVHFALVGLPPSPEEVTAFRKDSSVTARERVVDRLLASSHFGERWALHWLDLVRYAESRGHESDFIIPNAFEYRDYVVRALNADVPYDEFVREHIAGDLLPRPRRHPGKGFNESILGTGWAFLGEEIHCPVDTRQDETERIDNRIDVMTKTFLGLTVSCARCHDHKFDAITQRDYYALAGFFISTGQRQARFETMEDERELARKLASLREQSATKLASKVSAFQSPVLSKLKDYLSAASDAARADPNAAPKAGSRVRPSEFPKKITEAVRRLATERSLDVKIVGYWTAELLNAVNDPRDALHPLAAATRSNDGKLPKLDVGPGGIGLPAKARVVTDFAKLVDHEWYADGFGFGSRPARLGELQLVAPQGKNGPSLRVVTRGAAQSDLDWRSLELSPGVEGEPTVYGMWQRDGAMVRSPKFELTNGRIHYLVRGSGRVLAVVDSKRLILGGLDRSLIREWGFNPRWHWVSHDLSEFKGHRVAIEISPSNEFDTAIAMIVESEKPPAEPQSLGQRMAEKLSSRKLDSVRDVAAAYQEIFTAAVKTVPGSSVPTELSCEIRNWLVTHPELFSGEIDLWTAAREGAWPDAVSGLIREHLKGRESLLSRAKWRSRTAPAMMEGSPVDEYLLVRGRHQTPKGPVPRRFLEVLVGPGPIKSASGSGRKELAEIMTDPSNPLLARVMVNRVWHHLFGRGIVASVDNFGWLGQRPTHHELLDDLAAAFVKDDQWSLKLLLRRLVLSRTYAMSSRPDDNGAEKRDPENLLLHRMNLRRLEGEAIRDAMLAVSGRLDQRMHGASVPLHPSQFVEARGLRAERGPLDGDGRRSLYVAARRNFLPMMFTVFDTPTPFTTVGRRNVSNVPGQMLFLMNDPFVRQQGEIWASRLVSEMPDAPPEERIRRLFLAAFGREATAADIARCIKALREASSTPGVDKIPLEAWTEICHALFGVKEFIYVR